MQKSKREFFKKCIREFHNELLPQMGHGTDEELESVIDSCISNPSLFYIMEEGKGMILGAITPYMFNPSRIISTEIGWYVLPEHRNSRVGLKLIKQFEDESVARGADLLLMATLDANDISEYYIKKGYNAQEKFFYKEI